MTLEELLAQLGLTKTAEFETAIANYVGAQTAALKTNRDQLLKDVKRLKDGMKIYEGLDPSELAETLAELGIENGDVIEALKKSKSADPKNPDVKAQIEAAVAEATKAIQRKLDKTSKDLTEAQTALNTANKARIDETVERELTAQLSQHKGNIPLLLPALRGRVKGEIGEDGKVVLTVLAANGEEMQGAGGAVATVSTLVESIKADTNYGVAFEAEGGGSGAPAGTKRPAGVGSNPWAKESRNLTKQAEISRTNPALAAQLKKQAGIAA